MSLTLTQSKNRFAQCQLRWLCAVIVAIVVSGSVSAQQSATVDGAKANEKETIQSLTENLRELSERLDKLKSAGKQIPAPESRARINPHVTRVTPDNAKSSTLSSFADKQIAGIMPQVKREQPKSILSGEQPVPPITKSIESLGQQPTYNPYFTSETSRVRWVPDPMWKGNSDKPVSANAGETTTPGNRVRTITPKKSVPVRIIPAKKKAVAPAENRVSETMPRKLASPSAGPTSPEPTSPEPQLTQPRIEQPRIQTNQFGQNPEPTAVATDKRRPIRPIGAEHSGATMDQLPKPTGQPRPSAQVRTVQAKPRGTPVRVIPARTASTKSTSRTWQHQTASTRQTTKPKGEPVRIIPLRTQARQPAPQFLTGDDDEPAESGKSAKPSKPSQPKSAKATEHPATSTALVPGQMPQIPQRVSHGPFGRHLDGYRARAMDAFDAKPIVDRSKMDSFQYQDGESAELWWNRPLGQSIGLSNRTMPVSVATLIQTAVASSPFVKSILAEPHIRRAEVTVADAEFDTSSFLEGKFTDTNEPVGSILTTGVAGGRFRDESLNGRGGFRKKTRQGGLVEISQQIGYQDNNSQFLDPNPQGTTRLELNFTQPLMRDRGRVFNNTRILLAQLDYQIGNASVRESLEQHLIDVTRGYWDLYRSRAEYLQRKRLLQGAELLHEILEARDGIDSQKRQILRARVAVTNRASDLVRAETRIRDSQAQLRLLTGSQQLIDAQQFELTPTDEPLSVAVDISARQSITTALDNRADIAQAIRQVQAVSARVGAARNQVLPQLDLILGSYVAGLDGNRSSLKSFSNQFTDGRPTYWAGMVYELPIGNRASKSRLNRTRWEYAQAMQQFHQATEVAFTEVEIAVRETQTAYNEMRSRKQSINASQKEVEYLQQRWELLPDPNESAVLLIENLLDAQQRLADEEIAFVTAQVGYAMSWIQLRKVMGILLTFDKDSQMPITDSLRSSDSEPTDQATMAGVSPLMMSPQQISSQRIQTVSSPAIGARR